MAVGVQDRPADAPRDGVYVSDYKLVQHPSFTSAASALSSLVFAYSGTPAFFSIVSEMREPHHYNRSMVICQSVMTAIYISIGIVVYYFCGSYVSSPALGSAGPTMKKVAYGFALPALIVTTCIVIHVSAPFPLSLLSIGQEMMVGSFITDITHSCQENTSSSACCEAPST